MKIAIHQRNNSFSDRWIKYCKNNNIDYKIVNAYQTDIIEKVKDCDVFLWHHHHSKFEDVITAKKVLFTLEQIGKKVFPDFNSGWYFDDKVAEKYLLEAIDAPLVPSYVFYDEKTAYNWIEKTSFPKVAKLKGGASGIGVFLIKDKNEGIKFVKRMFGKGFSQDNPKYRVKESVRLYQEGKGSIRSILSAMKRYVSHSEFSKLMGREKGYAFFQDFIPNSDFDIRVMVVAGKAFAIKQLTRKNDFKASNSGYFIYDKDQIDLKCIKIALETTEKLKSSCTGFDFVFDPVGNPLIVEMGYGFIPDVYNPCPGYWDRDLKWHEGPFEPVGWIIEDIMIK